MSEYKRLTVRHPNSDYIAITETKQLQETRESKIVLNRLAELEDKIEDGTLKELPENAVVFIPTEEQYILLAKEDYSNYLILQQNHEFIREKAKELQADNERLYKNIGKFKDNVRKETAREIICKVKEILKKAPTVVNYDGYDDGCGLGGYAYGYDKQSVDYEIDKLAKEYGVEVK